jgi:AcrR family transcriptional regulator
VTGRPRGAHLLDAVLEIVAEKGFHAVSMRTVAARANVSVAQVQYYYRTKADLVAAAFERATAEFVATVRSLLDEPASLERLRDVVWQWLPLDPERESRARVWLAYTATAVTEASLTQTAAQLDAELREWFTSELTTLQAAGEINSELDPAQLAGQLLALIDGATMHCLVLATEERAQHAEHTVGAWLEGLRPRD